MTYAKANKAAILERAKKFATQEVEVPEWETTVIIKELSGSERDRYEQSVLKINPKTGTVIPDMINARARLVAYSIVDENGNRMFTDSQEDVLSLGSLPSKGLNTLYEAAQKISGLSDDDIEEAAENFVEAPETPTSD